MAYVPDWIKEDRSTYFRARNASGVEIEAISPFCETALKADARAFSSLMRHIRDFDQRDHTVILMQVENETGLPKTDRDYSSAANAAFSVQPPSKLLTYLSDHRGHLELALENAWKDGGYRRQGTWTEIFGSSAAEMFSAWAVSQYVDSVAAAGKAEYSIPFYVNAFIMVPGAVRAGDWNSGGPTKDVLDVWKAIAHHIDILGPDIYEYPFPEMAAPYIRPDNVLFVPETGFAPYYIPYVFTTLADNGIGFSPFGIDRNYKDGMLTDAASALEEDYRILRPLLPIIERNRYTGNLFSIVGEMNRHESLAIPVGNSLTAVVHFDETSSLIPALIVLEDS